jgi:hypothetical protein
MTQQYGFRTTNSLSEVLDRNVCLDNLGIDRRDLALLVGTSDAGVTEGDYQNIIGLTSSLEQQIVVLASGATAILPPLLNKASRFGDVFTGSIFASGINNDRPYYDAANTIYGPSTASFFSPANASGFSSGAQYKLGPVFASTTVVSGLTFNGTAPAWNDYFVRYKQYLRFTENAASTIKRAPLYLAPPSSFSSNKVWLDAEFSSFVQGTGGQVEQWQDVLGRGSATQLTLVNRPTRTLSLRNGKPGIVFDGTNDFMSLGNLGALFPSAATVIIVASLGEPNVRGDADYNLFSTLNNTAVRWRAGGVSGSLGAFTSTVQTGFPAVMPANGTYVFTVRASQALGLSVRTNSLETATRSNQFFTQATYAAGDTYVLGANANGSAGFLNGTIFSIALFDKVLTDKELRSLEEYFAWRFDYVFDPDRTQAIELEDGQPLETEGDVTTVLG